MKIRADIVRMYKDVHSWVGIVAGLTLFVAFYAGAITMFSDPLQNWASHRVMLSPPPSLEQTPRLLEAAFSAHPEAQENYTITLETDAANPARLSWSNARGRERFMGARFYASLDAQGHLETVRAHPSEIGLFIDGLHEKVGLPFGGNITSPIMGVVALLYGVALISGTIILLPSLFKDLFAVRIGGNIKRMWLDLHNVLGFFSLPFHIVMALTSVVFAFHPQLFVAQKWMLGLDNPAHHRSVPHERSRPAPATLLPPIEIVEALKQQAPGFSPTSLEYTRQGKNGPLKLQIAGTDPRYPLRGGTFGFAGVDPATGRIVETLYMPGQQSAAFSLITAFFALHFGNFGGQPIRWAYFILGMAGAFLFYTGNLLWIESRRKRERKSGIVTDTRSTRILHALTLGCTLGCVAGISVTLCATPFLENGGSYGIISDIYYAIFCVALLLAFLLKERTRKVTLLMLAGITTALIPVCHLSRTTESSLTGQDVAMFGVSMLGGMLLAWCAWRVHRTHPRSA